MFNFERKEFMIADVRIADLGWRRNIEQGMMDIEGMRENAQFSMFNEQ